jgi:hypothetical protein
MPLENQIPRLSLHVHHVLLKCLKTRWTPTNSMQDSYKNTTVTLRLGSLAVGATTNTFKGRGLAGRGTIPTQMTLRGEVS